MFSTYRLYISTLLAIGLIFLQSCSVKRQLTKELSNNQAHNYFTGLMVYNPEQKQTLISINPDQYFTPASTVKLFTLYTSLHYLSDSIATLSILETPDTLFIKPLADPSFLHDSLPNTTFDFLKSQAKPIAIVKNTFEDFIYGNGWQWDDYQYYYMPELSVFPIYGNVTILNGQRIVPSFFQDSLKQTNKPDLHRDFFNNTFYFYQKNLTQNRKIPFKTSLELSAKLLSDTLKKPVYFSHIEDVSKFKPYKSTPTLPLYSRLMNESENFMAEHLLLQVSHKETSEFKVANSIKLAMDSLFTDIPQIPRWVDGSGLSRYNLFTPHSMVYVLDKLQQKFGKEKAMSFMPKNGEGESLQKWYPADQTFLYAKTGSVSNNHNLCGYLTTKKGTFLIFSYMNNNFVQKSSDIRTEMNKVLHQIYFTY